MVGGELGRRKLKFARQWLHSQHYLNSGSTADRCQKMGNVLENFKVAFLSNSM